MTWREWSLLGLMLVTVMVPVFSQPPIGGPPGFPGGFPGGFPCGPGGFGGPPSLGGQQRKFLKEFDKDKNGYLDHTERQAAREAMKNERPGGGRGGSGGFPGFPGGPGGFGGPPGKGGKGGGEAPKPGKTISPSDVPPVTNAGLYDPKVLRTVFLEFDKSDWERELEDFHGSDIDVPCQMTVDGKTYKYVGVHFRGMSS